MEQVERANVAVTFLRMDARPAEPPPTLPAGDAVHCVTACSVPFYRYLYNTVGHDYLWWLRRTLPDAELAALLASPAVSIHVLMRGGEPAGFYELDARSWPDMNLSYFGLMPQAIGSGAGYALLCHAIDAAWSTRTSSGPPRGMTVNTCTADHPRALPSYVRAGFRVVRVSSETWHVPTRLGLRVPSRLRV